MTARAQILGFGRPEARAAALMGPWGVVDLVSAPLGLCSSTFWGLSGAYGIVWNSPGEISPPLMSGLC